MSRVGQSRASLSRFFLLVFAGSIPFWLAGEASDWQPIPGVPVSGLTFVCPAVVATILVGREGGFQASLTLCKRAFDYGRIANCVWILPLLFLMPAIMVTSYAAMRLIGLPLPMVEMNWSSVVPLFLLFFFAASGEELGWSGYAIEPLQRRWGALRASLILGAVWAIWHIVPLVQVGRAVDWIAGWCVATMATRVLHTWMYNNTGKSVFGQALFHASSNTSWQMFPNGGSHYDPRITGLILALVASLVVMVFGLRGPSAIARGRSS